MSGVMWGVASGTTIALLLLVVFLAGVEFGRRKGGAAELKGDESDEHAAQFADGFSSCDRRWRRRMSPCPKCRLHRIEKI